MNSAKLRRAARGGLLCGGTLLVNWAICASSENFREFRQTAGPEVQGGIKTILDGGEDGLSMGLNSILDGIIDGAFAVVAPDGADE